MAKLNPAEAAAKWKNRTVGAQADYVKGVRSTDKDPIQLAIASKDKWFARIQEAQANDRFAKGLGKSSKAAWAKAAEDKGGPRITQGVTSAEPRMAAFMQAFLPAQKAITDEVRSMPSTTLDQRLQRMVEQARKTAGLKGNY